MYGVAWDAIHYDHSSRVRKRRRCLTLLAACRRENIESREEALELGGFKPEVIDIEAHCVQRAMQLIDASDNDEHGEDELLIFITPRIIREGVGVR